MSPTFSSATRREWHFPASNGERGASECPQECSTDELIASAKEGDLAAQRRLYEEHCRSIYGLIVRIVGQQDAADVTQEVFLQVFRKLAQFSGRSQFSTWLFRLAVNEALQHLRKKGRSAVQSLKFDVADRSPTSTRRREDAELLEAALVRLDPQLRCMFLLREVEGMDYRSIALALNIPEGTVASALNRARQRLRTHLIELGWQP